MAYKPEFERRFIVSYNKNKKDIKETAKELNLDIVSAKYLEKKLCKSITSVKVEKPKEVKAKDKTSWYWSDKDIARLKILKGQGYTTRYISEALGRSMDSVYLMVHRMKNNNSKPVVKSLLDKAIKTQVVQSKPKQKINTFNSNIQVNTELVGEKEVRITIKC